ncbi:proton-dependent oligopeptide transporter, POT family [Mariniphaga anaerophila]|uniref:Proton-dependent oligopeptide transporter, POT family n=1 Tax=Mariniphaga anaerophila TaxID=1484053 RepID=A0A1M5FWN6_9BACT|nr:peptide MFS transporter [Mariniphaga anaerophila]SHF95955.1 proton-dependent oligopeptide transporter, POT family [Mariniphaga anaerophila]
MFKNHPKGLIVAFFANMGERFGFYTMMAILVLFLQAKYGVNAETAGSIYSWFYFAIYALALLGGIIADATKKYKSVILSGIIIMFAGYVLMAIPGMPLSMTVVFLFTIALGNGLFKGNLQAVVGQMYDNPKYEKLRDKAFLIFYMGINVGAFFAPFAATAVRNWWLKTNGFVHDGSLPALCHQIIDGNMEHSAQITELANKVSLNGPVTDITEFAHEYIAVFSKGYNYAFAVAAGAMLISLLVYIFFSKLLPTKEVTASTNEVKVEKSFSKIGISLGVMAVVALVIYFVFGNSDIGFAFGLFAGFVAWMLQSSTKEERPRVTALLLVFLVVIFFWMSFHQNGLTQTMFARDYTTKTVGPFTFLFFRLDYILAFIGTVVGLVLLLRKKLEKNVRILGGALFVGLGFLTYYFFSRGEADNAIAPEIFQSFNPLFIVSLTFLVMGIFTWLANRGKEPSTPKKIGIGMIIASFGFLIMLVASLDVISPVQLQGEAVPDTSRVSPYWLMSSYMVLTIAELFLSPMGLSFVSKVSPARFQGLMQGGWLLATAVGNKLLGIGSYFWDRLELWQLWAIFVVCCLASAAFIFSIMKRLERLTK